jgi:HEAT repeat protein
MRTLFVLIALAPFVAADDRLDSKDVAKRLAAIEAIRAEGGEAAEALLIEALGDDDWEVVHRAVEALGERGSSKAVTELVAMAIKGPVRKIRLAAAGSLKKLDAAAAAEALARRMKTKDVIAVAEALEILAQPESADLFMKLAKDRGKDATKRLYGMRGLAALGRAEDMELLVKAFKDPDFRVRAAAVAGLAATGEPGAASPLREGLKDPEMPAVMVRRHIAGLRTLMLGMTDEKKRRLTGSMCARSLGMSGKGAVDARFARLLGSLGRADAPVGPVKEYLAALSGSGLSHSDAEVRGAAVMALARLGNVDSYERIGATAQQDSNERVRFHALRAAVQMRKAGAQKLMIDRLRYEKSPMVREEAAALLGRFRVKEGFNSLRKALEDAHWEVVVSAAISLGKLRDPQALAPLVEICSHKDWRIRGAGVAGLGWMQNHEAVDHLIAALRDKEPAVAATAREFLRHISGEKLPISTKPWHDWWERKRKVFVFRKREEELKQAKKYGYALQPRKVYEDLDVIVLQTRRGGDNIQDLLEEYGIEHRIIRAASVEKAALHPHALFVANCPGEIVKKDVERLQWFVRAGGYMFASCWALTHTVQACFPDVVQKLHTRAQVVDTVASERCPVNSPFTAGVFDNTTIPLWELVGSHLIDVLDPERFEVLLDSPECATRWGDGNLAGWFSIGHGTVLDSANHFDMQGMRQTRPKTEKERMAFAVDHLGYDYEELRKLRGEGVFLKQPIAVKRTRDLSIFRFITTFVRQKRLADEQ